MRTFYTGNDIEDLAASGVRQLEVGPNVSLTDAARERAEELGIVLVTAGSAQTAKAVTPAAPAKSVSLPSKPRGCQHGPMPVAKVSNSESAATGGPVVDQLVKAVSALNNKRGG